MFSLNVRPLPFVAVLIALGPGMAQQTKVPPEKASAITQQTIEELINRLAAH
jgi:hypothetical protein